jgi:hypothetical protein
MNDVILALLLLAQGAIDPSAGTGTISGRVINMDGTAAVRVRVAAQPVTESPAAAAESPVLTSIVQTDAQGNYRLEGVTPGRFYISAGLLNLPTYYPGVISIAEARIVTVASGTAVNGIDFTVGRVSITPAVGINGNAVLLTSAMARVEGRAILSSELLPVDRLMRLIGNPTVETTINADGTFVFPKVVSSMYSWHSNVGWTSIAIPNRDITDLLLRGIPGRVVMESGTLDRGVYFQANNGTSAATVAADGTFTLILTEGSYRFQMSALPEGAYIKSILYGATELSNQTLIFSRDVAIADLTVTIAIR